MEGGKRAKENGSWGLRVRARERGDSERGKGEREDERGEKREGEGSRGEK